MADQGGTHPLIHYGYENKEDMFDAHSYNKGGLVLHMLRNIVGDDAFFASLSKYLKDNEFTAVETAELRMAFEETTGLDLNWFFDQWYLDKGHPIMDVSYGYEEGKVIVYAQQKQEVDAHRPIFILPLEAAIYAQDGSVSYHQVVVDDRKDTIMIEGINEKPLVTVLDGKAVLLGEITEKRSSEELVGLMKYSPNHFDKRTALNQLRNTEAIKELVPGMLTDKHHIIRNAGLEYMDDSKVDEVKKMITSDEHSTTRAKALKTYHKFVGEASMEIAEQVLSKEQAYIPIMAAIDIVKMYDKTKAIKYADRLKDENANSLVGYLTGIYAESGNPKYLEYIENNFKEIGVYQLFSVFGKYSELLLQQESGVMMEKAMNLKTMAIEDENMYRKYLSTNTINSIKVKLNEELSVETDETKKTEVSKNVEILTSIIDEIISKEKDESLLSRYNSFK